MGANIFFSYAHKDEQLKDTLATHLRPLERQGLVSVWYDARIDPGAEWKTEISRAIEKADVAILLISPDYLASEYVVEDELPALFRRAQQGSLVIAPILVRPTHWTAIRELAQFQFLNEPTRPLASARDRDEALAEVVRRLYDLLSAVGARSEIEPAVARQPTHAPSEPIGPDRHLFLSHSKVDGDFAELLKHRLEQIGYTAWIDTDRLDAGVDWRKEIDDSIRNALALIVIMSPEARISEYVTYEWAFAWGTGKRIIPIMLRQTSLHPRLATLQYLDFTNRNARPWPRLYDTLRSLRKGAP